MRISGIGTKNLKRIWFFIVVMSLLTILIMELFSIKCELIVILWFILIVFGGLYFCFIRRLNVVHVSWKKKELIMDKGKVSFQDILSIKRYWLYFYKVNYCGKDNVIKSFIFILSPIYFFYTPDYIRLLKKRIKNNKRI